MINTDKRIYVAGHNGMVGSAILRALNRHGYNDVLITDRDQLDLTDQQGVNKFFKNNEIGIVYNAAAKVGGILGNANYPGDFILENLTIQNNLAKACLENNVDRYDMYFITTYNKILFPQNNVYPLGFSLTHRIINTIGQLEIASGLNFSQRENRLLYKNISRQ